MFQFKKTIKKTIFIGQETFLFTSGYESVLNKSYDYGIKRIPSNCPLSLTKSLQSFLLSELQYFSDLTDQHSNKSIIIIGSNNKRVKIAIPLQISKSTDHVNRENFKLEGKIIGATGSGEKILWEMYYKIPRGTILRWIDNEFASQEIKKILKQLQHLIYPHQNFMKIAKLGIVTFSVLFIFIIFILIFNNYDSSLNIEKNASKTQQLNFNEKLTQKDRMIQIAKKAKQTLLWLSCFFNHNGSVLAKMPDGGKAGKPEDWLRQYIEYVYPRVKILSDFSKTDKKVWNQCLYQLIKDHQNKYFSKIRKDLKQTYLYNQCKINIKKPILKFIGKSKPEKIKIYAWKAFHEMEKDILIISILSSQ